MAASNKQADMALPSTLPPSSPSTAAAMLRAGTQCQSVRLTRTVLLSKGASLLYIPGTSDSFYGLAGQEQSSRFLQEGLSSGKRSRRWHRWRGALVSVRGTTEHGSSSSFSAQARGEISKLQRAPIGWDFISVFWSFVRLLCSTLFLFRLPFASAVRGFLCCLCVYPLSTPSLPQAGSPPCLENGGSRHRQS